MHETGTQGWSIAMTQRDRMGREVGKGFRMGNTGKPMADSYQCMPKSLQMVIAAMKLKDATAGHTH